MKLRNRTGEKTFKSFKDSANPADRCKTVALFHEFRISVRIFHVATLST